MPLNVWSFIWHFLKPYKYQVFIYICIALLAGCWGPINSLLIKEIINLLTTLNIENPDISVLMWPGAALVFNFLVFDNFTWRSINYLNYKYQPLIKNSIIAETFEYLLGSSHQFFHDNLSGRVASQIKTLADNIERILHGISAPFIRGIALLLVALVSMYLVNPLFFYTLALWAICFALFSVYMSRTFVILSDRYAETDSTVSGLLVDSISNIQNIRMFARSHYEVLRLKNALLPSKKAFQENELFMIKLNWGQGLLILFLMAFMVYFLILLYGQHRVSIGDFALILGLSMEVGHISWFTMSQVDEFNKAIGKCKQSLQSLIVAHDIQDKKSALPLSIRKGKIHFREIDFCYKATKPLFQKLSVRIEPGQKVGLVGYSGGGKSTFVNLILRFFDIQKGHIDIDDQDIRDVTQDSLRQNIALIPQDPTLFHRSLMENIRYGSTDATDEAVIEASKKAHAHDFIQKLSQGYNALVGERGVKLSGGQRQRIAIARAILKNAPILILDEATSQLDSVTENHIQESLWNLMENKTTLVIAHRLSTLLHMDRILVFDQGKIVEDGTHSELLELNGLYKTLWNTQIGGFLQDKKIRR